MVSFNKLQIWESEMKGIIYNNERKTTESLLLIVTY